MSEPNIAVIDFFCGITNKSSQTLLSVMDDVAAGQPDEIVIRLSSTGGGLAPAFAIYYFLRTVNIPLTVYNFGNVESSAILLYLAGSTRGIVPHGRFLIHPFDWTFASNPVYLPALREAVAALELDSRRYAEIFKERTNNADNPIDVLKCLNGEPLVIGAEIACSCGLATINPAMFTVPTGARHNWIIEA